MKDTVSRKRKTRRSMHVQQYYRNPSGKALVIHARDEPPFLRRRRGRVGTRRSCSPGELDGTQEFCYALE
jgi:hypothetical protein